MQTTLLHTTDEAHENPVVRKKGISGDPLRVLYVVSMFPCWSETFIAREINELLKSGVEVHVLSLRPWQESFQQENQARISPLVLYPPDLMRCLAATALAAIRHPVRTFAEFARSVGSLWMHPIQLAKTLGTLVRMHGVMSGLRDKKLDHIHAHWATYPSTAALFMAASLNISFSFTAHAHDIFIHDQLLKEKLRRAAFVATISEFNRTLFLDRYKEAAKGKIEIVHCGVTKEVLQRKRPLFRNWHKDKPARIVSIGRLDEIKGFSTLLDACQLLDQNGISFTCDIIGDGPMRDTLQKHAHRRNLQHRVHFFSALPSEKIYQLMSGADIFVLACQQGRDGNMDGIPVVLMEAMCIGVPCISTRLSGVPELIKHDRNGLLAEPGDSAGISNSIMRLLANPELATRLAVAARKTVAKDFSAELETMKLRDLFSRSVATAKQGRAS
jgi:glycosyltransferase involved in cell wall biosynthesis